MVNYKKLGWGSLWAILLLTISFSIAPKYSFSQDVRSELDPTYRWFRNNPPKTDGSNFQARRERSVYDIADARILEQLNPARPVNLFILHIANALNVFDAVNKVKPEATIYDHVMELGHPIDKYRWSYEFTYDKIKNQPPASSYVLTWGERLDVGTGKDNSSK